MQHVLLENQEALGDEDMAALIHLFVGKVKMEEEDSAVEDFSLSRPNYLPSFATSTRRLFAKQRRLQLILSRLIDHKLNL